MSNRPGISILCGVAWALLYMVAIVVYAQLSQAACSRVAPALEPYVDLAISAACQAAFVALLMRRRKFKFDPFENVTRRGVVWALLGAPVLVGAGLLLDPLLTRLLPYSERLYNESIDAMTAVPAVALVSACVVAPVFEETVFRRFALDGLARRYGNWPGLLMASTLFALLHLNPYQIAGVFLTGVGLGVVYLRTRSLGCCILMHSAYNLLVLAISWAVG